MDEIRSTFSTTVERPPSCIEFLPSDRNYALIGTYELEKNGDEVNSDVPEGSTPTTSPQKRSGSIVVLRLEDDILLVVTSPPSDFLTSVQI
jgi:diphthamide biosynthesis protein 7